MKRKSPQRKLEDELWEHCKRIIRTRYALEMPKNDTGVWECYTCGISITYKKDAHTGHFIAKSVCGAFLKYDLRNLRIQCMTCNVWRGGNGAVFYKNMVEREGQKYVDKLFKDKQKTTKSTDYYTKLLQEYKNL